MSKRWVTPSFDAAAIATTEAEPGTLSKKRKTKNTGGATRRRRPVAGTNSSTSVTVKKGAVGVDLLSKYQPETPEDLVIHVKKVDQVRTWIRERISNGSGGNGKYLLLHGPSGSGKSTTFRVLAKSLNVKIIEWITPLDREWLAADDYNIDDDGGGDEYNRYFRTSSSAGDTFDNFLWRASRYSCLTTGIENEPASPALKVILVKDFPHSFVQNPHSFHDILRKYRHYSTYPVVFVCNDDSTSRDLFPESIRSECGVQDIAFNAVNCTAITKALKRVLEIELVHNPQLVGRLPDDVSLQSFHEQSGGDLRCALLKLYFAIIKPSPSQKEQIPATAIGGSTNNSEDNAAAAVKDQHSSADLFRILGRILYCKREPLTQTQPQVRHARDYTFVHDPDQLAKSLADRPSTLTNFLQENYVSRFEDLTNVAAVADTFCVADVALKHHYSSRETVADVIVLNGLVRRLMVSNIRPKKSFAPFVKPRTYDSAETYAALFSRNIRKVSPSHFHFSSPALVTHVLPFARVIPSADELQHHLRQMAKSGHTGRLASSLMPA
ncbi:cell cycle checkpoint protein RAD17 [Planococcus citri]|uniref:cell cycle checkpoint protein RAD17 n=1 Tax=Planococcus citri TaxID=170843 RepID=UPI0031F76557